MLITITRHINNRINPCAILVSYRCLSCLHPTKCNSVNTTTFSENGERTHNRSSVNEEEVQKFNNMAASWWDKDGICRPLHSMNDLRVPLIRDGLIHTKITNEEHALGPTPLLGTRILDVGCGGGILSEPLARLGAEVTGIDASSENIKIAILHAEKSSITKSNIKYIHGSVEDHSEEVKDKYDAVVISEVMEHVSDPSFFIETCTSLVRPGGSFFITTINRTEASWLGAIIIAEYILKLLPPGTHDWNKFLRIEEMKTLLESNSLRVRLIHGMMYIPFLNKWRWTPNKAINYALHAVKES